MNHKIRQKLFCIGHHLLSSISASSSWYRNGHALFGLHLLDLAGALTRRMCVRKACCRYTLVRRGRNTVARGMQERPCWGCLCFLLLLPPENTLRVGGRCG